MTSWSYMHPGDLREYAENPRTINGEAFERLIRSIEAAPEMLEARPIIGDVDSGDIVGGNMRHRAIQAMLRNANAAVEYPRFTAYYERHGGVPVYLHRFNSESEKREWVLRDNNGYGTYVEEELAAFLRAGIESGMDLSLTGFTQDELDALLSVGNVDVEPEDAGVDPDDLPVYGVIVECRDEMAQGELLEELSDRGYEVRSIL